VAAGPNGGYVAAIVLRALEHAVGNAARSPRSLTLHYTAAPGAGPLDLETRIERSGRSLTTATARASQGGRLLVLAIAAFSLPRESRAFEHASMPEVPSPDGLAPSTRPIPLARRYEIRYVPGAGPDTGADRPWVAGWIRTAEPRALDGPLLAAYCDALVPPLLAWRGGGRELGPFPTVDLTVHFRAPLPRPDCGAGDFCLASFASRTLRDGFVEEDGEIWSRSGVLLAQSRQLAIATGRGLPPAPSRGTD